MGGARPPAVPILRARCLNAKLWIAIASYSILSAAVLAVAAGPGRTAGSRQVLGKRQPGLLDDRSTRDWPNRGPVPARGGPRIVRGGRRRALAAGSGIRAREPNTPSPRDDPRTGSPTHLGSPPVTARTNARNRGSPGEAGDCRPAAQSAVCHGYRIARGPDRPLHHDHSIDVHGAHQPQAAMAHGSGRGRCGAISQAALALETELLLAEAADAAIEVIYLQELAVLQGELSQLAAKTAEVLEGQFQGGTTRTRRQSCHAWTRRRSSRHGWAHGGSWSWRG